MEYKDIFPHIRFALDYTVPPNWVLKERVIFDHELLYVRHGEVCITIDDEPHFGKPGDFFIIKPRQKHSMYQVGDIPFRHPHIHFDFHTKDDSEQVNVCFKPLSEITPKEALLFREDFLSESRMDIPSLIRLSNPSPAVKMMDNIIRQFELKPAFYKQECRGIFIQLIIYIIRDVMWQDSKYHISNYELLTQIKDQILLKPENDISIQQLADQANFSQSYFMRIFKQAFGTTPIKFQQQMRIEKAKRLILSTNASMTEIAELCGYQSIHAFSASFKKLEKVPPSFYR